MAEQQSYDPKRYRLTQAVSSLNSVSDEYIYKFDAEQLVEAGDGGPVDQALAEHPSAFEEQFIPDDINFKE